jgi:hypothetical protein
MLWIRDPYRRPRWSRERWDRERWLNVLFFAIVAAGVAGLLVFFASPQLALRTFVGNGGIGWWDRVGVMPGWATPESPEELAGPSDLVAAVARWLQPDAPPQAFTGLYETFLAPVIGTEPTTGAGNEGYEAPPAIVPHPTPPVPSPTTTAFPPGPTSTATNSPEPPASETSSPSPSDSPTESPSPSDSPTESPSPSDSPTDPPSPSDSPTDPPSPSDSPTAPPSPSDSPTDPPSPSDSPSAAVPTSEG